MASRSVEPREQVRGRYGSRLDECCTSGQNGKSQGLRLPIRGRTTTSPFWPRGLALLASCVLKRLSLLKDRFMQRGLSVAALLPPVAHLLPGLRPTGATQHVQRPSHGSVFPDLHAVQPGPGGYWGTLCRCLQVSGEWIWHLCKVRTVQLSRGGANMKRMGSGDGSGPAP